MDAISRIRDFALTGADGQGHAARQGVGASAPNFDRSDSVRKLRRRRVTTSPSLRDDPSEQEMCRIVRPHGFVVRVDATALQANRPAVKLFRFADRRHPAGVFERFDELVHWLTDRTSRT